MKAIVLCAGYAKRLYPLTSFIAKPLLPVCGKPVLNYIVDKVSHIKDVDEIFITTNKKFHSQFEEWLKYNKNDYDKKLTLFKNTSFFGERNVGGVDSVSKIMKKTKDKEGYLIIAGDNLINYSLREALGFFRKRKTSTVVLAKIPKKEAHKFGVVEIDENYKITNFKEKPQKPKSNLIATLIYFFTYDEIKTIEEYNKSPHKGDSFGHLLKYLYRKRDVFGYKPKKGEFIDIGSLKDYKKASRVCGSWK